MAANHQLDDELRPDAEASRIIEDRDLMDIDIKELNKMLKERNVSKELAVRQKPITMHCQEIVTVATNVKRAICDLSHDALICEQYTCVFTTLCFVR